jgi:hypothetical protein
MDKINLATLTSLPIMLADTAIGRHQQTIKKQVKNVITKISWEENQVEKETGKHDEMEEEDHSPSISVMPNLDNKSHHQSLMSSPPRITQNGQQ